MKELKIGALLSYTGVAFNALSGLLYTPWMISCIGTSDYGLYTLAMSAVNLFLLDFGLGDAVSRFLSTYYAKGDEDSANAFLGVVLKLYTAISAIVFLLLFFVYINIDSIYANLGTDQVSVFKQLYIIVAIYSVISLPLISFNGILTANEKFIALNGLNLIQKIAAVGLIVIALLFDKGVFAIVLINAGTSLFCSLVKYLVIAHQTKVRFSLRSASQVSYKEVLGFSFWSMIVQICQRFIFTVMPSVLAIVSNTWEITVFGLASSLESYVYTVASALNGLFMPKVSRILNSNDMDKLHDLNLRIGRIQLVIVGGIIAGFVAIGSRFVSCWVGPEYEILVLSTVLLILPSLFDLPLLVENTALVAAGYVKQRGLIYIVMAILNIVLGFLLSFKFGSVGACAAICISYFVRIIGQCRLYIKYLQFDVPSFFKSAFPRWVIAAAVAITITTIASSLISNNGWLGLILCSVVYFSIYVASSFVVYLNKSEIQLFKSMVGLKR